MTDDLRRDVEDAYEKHVEPVRWWTKRALRGGAAGARTGWKILEGSKPIWTVVTALGTAVAAYFAYRTFMK